MPPRRIPSAYPVIRIAASLHFAASAGVKGSPGTRRMEITVLLPAPSLSVPRLIGPSLEASPSFHPRLTSIRGNLASSTIFDARRFGFLRVNGSFEIAAIHSLESLNATGVMLRWPMLLSCGTSRHSAIVSPGEKLLTLLASPFADTIMNTHSWPTWVGFHLNGPTISSAPLFGATFGAESCAVDIGV